MAPAEPQPTGLPNCVAAEPELPVRAGQHSGPARRVGQVGSGNLRVRA